jgi:hypothetical protein
MVNVEEIQLTLLQLTIDLQRSGDQLRFTLDRNWKIRFHGNLLSQLSVDCGHAWLLDDLRLSMSNLFLSCRLLGRLLMIFELLDEVVAPEVVGWFPGVFFAAVALPLQKIFNL